MSNTNGFVDLPVGIYLNVRQEPNLYSTVLTSLAPKTELTILEQNGEWYKINYKGSAAYVFASAVEATSTIEQAGMSLNLGVPNNFEFGNTGEQPTFNWNALVTTSFIPIKNSAGVVQNGYSTSNGDHITIIKSNPELGLTFIQYPDQGANMYQQGWIDSAYVSSQYLNFRFSQAWLNQADNQKVYLFDNTTSSTTLNQNTKYTLLYTVSNYNIEYSCILFDENGQQQLGFVPFKTGTLSFIVPEYPYNISNECSVGYLEPTVPLNATVNNTVDLIDINGIKPYSYINKKNITIYPSLSSGERISVLQAFTSAEEQSILIEYYDSGSNTYKKAYLPIETLNNNSVSIDKNTITWKNTTGIYDLVDLTDSSIIYKLPASQSVQYLYRSGDFACILFNNNNLSGWPIQTAYTKLSNGSFIQKSPEVLHGFVHKNGKTYYFNENGVMQTGWQTINGNVYVFNAQGVMQTGWIKEWGATYYFNTNGTQATGWQTINGNVYVFNTQGVMQTGWIKEWGATYYFNTNGTQATGWSEIDNSWYFFNTQGVMQTGWIEWKNIWYYLESNGTMATNTTIDGWNINSNGASNRS